MTYDMFDMILDLYDMIDIVMFDIFKPNRIRMFKYSTSIFQKSKLCKNQNLL